MANYICLAFFALLLVLMFFLPDYRIALVALPSWILALGVIYAGMKSHQRRRALTSGPAPSAPAPKSCPDEIAAQSSTTSTVNN